jgi:hypothetical protein
MNFTDTPVSAGTTASPASARATNRARVATVTIAIALALAATMTACSSSKTGAGALGSATTAASASSSSPVGGSASNGPPAATPPAGGTVATSQLCTDFVTQSVALLQPILPLLASASTDPAALQKAIPQIKTAMTAWAKLMSEDANKAKDPALAEALRDTAKQIDQATAQVNAGSDATSPAIVSLLTAGQNLKAACPNISQLGQ